MIITLLFAGCSKSGSAGPHAGTVDVLYAGSLVSLMNDVKPAFDSTQGGNLQGVAGGSDELANEIKNKAKQADVFISAATAPNDQLMGAANGGWESWYATFATAPLVIGYNPKSSFAHDLQTKPWTEVIAEPGFRMGSTDPALDPKGKLAEQALQDAGIPSTKLETFPEQDLVAKLTGADLDAGFLYSSEAADAHLPTISLGNTHLGATYTISVLNNGPNPAGAQDFVNFLLGSRGKALLTQHGLVITPIKVTGNSHDVPSGLRSTLGM